MKKLLLITMVSALSIPAMAESDAQPKVLEDAIAYSMSANAKYIVSSGYFGIKIFDMESGKSFDFTEYSDNGLYTTGMSRCVSDNGIVLGYEWDEEAQYWKDGEWTAMKVPANATSTNLVHSITPDGRRICGSIGVAEMNYTEDRLMQAPCIWNWDEASGDFGDPVMLPHPDKDYTNRVPQLITAVDISEDGKTIVGQVVTAVGTVRYPIIYNENDNGEWDYVIPDEKVLFPEGAVIPAYPGDFETLNPTEEEFMTEEEIEAYTEAYTAWIESGYSLPYPDHKDYMTAEEYEAFEKAFKEYQDVYNAWEEKYMDFVDYYYGIAAQIPDYELNSIRISPDGKTYANTVNVANDDPFAWPARGSRYIWVFDIASGAITKYEQENDFVLTTLLNDGVALATTKMGEAPQSYVLANGKCTNMYDWMAEHNAVYAAWLKENLTFEIEEWIYDEATDNYDAVFSEVTLTGRAYATPDMSTVVIGVENVWDGYDDGITCVFDMSIEGGVGSVVASDRERTIYDLSGRKLKNASTPGIYIINGEKKMVR